MKSIPAMIADGIRTRIHRWAYTKATTQIRLTDPGVRKVFGIDLGDQEELTDPFKQLPIVRAAISAKAANIAQVPFVIRQRGADEPVPENHPLVELFNDINPYLSKYDFFELIVTYMDGWGDAPIFLEREFERAPGIPQFLWMEFPTMVRAAKYQQRFV